MNTKIEYLYRDADNYKAWNECVIAGELTQQQIELILGCRVEERYFIPSDVGLPENRFDYWDEQSDHDWFELYDHSFETTAEKPTVDVTAERLVEAFLAHKEDWEER